MSRLIKDHFETDPEVAYTVKEDSIIASLRQELLERSERGIQKYGVTLDRNDLSEVEWLQHLKEELLDGAGYVQKLINLKKQ